MVWFGNFVKEEGLSISSRLSACSILFFFFFFFFAREQSSSTGGKTMPGEELPLTIFYGGDVLVIDVNQQQARSIVLLAAGCGRTTGESSSTAGIFMTRDSSRKLGTASLSMKRSLQVFLEKRKHRIRSANGPRKDK
ncbi:hypothetical protein MLD38_010339 [Melastoma candidum]|uniref:Uncharacterized protein n=1 Tax=Melastoma candidum TaxID=119954 RepID=A0ACB9QZJ8_9MYRT|nr:hypothetical protein MLD38_010339 [Melastoma candidum]